MTFAISSSSSDTPTAYDFDRKFDRIYRLPSDIVRKIKSYDNLPITIVGVGGIGFHIAKALAMTVKNLRLTIIDDDDLEDVNLNRFDIDPMYIGDKKVNVAKDIVMTLNPYAEVHTIDKPLQHVGTIETAILINEADNVEVDNYIATSGNVKYSIYLAMKYNGFDKATLYVNSIGFSADEKDDPYIIMPSFYSTATIFANYLVYFMLTHTPSELSQMKFVKNIDLSKLIQLF